jgi:polyisoprenoid-binding protein YceI
MRQIIRFAILILSASVTLPSSGWAQQVPVFALTTAGSSINFHVSSSVALDGSFNKWSGTLRFSSPEVTSGVLDLQIEAASVSTGSSLKDGTLKGEDFFDVKDNPTITFRSMKIEQTGPVTFDVPGNFTIRGVSKPETLKLTVSGKGTGSGSVQGTMAFDRREYGMNSGIPFIRIADRVEVTVDIKGERVSGPPLVFKQ